MKIFEIVDLEEPIDEFEADEQDQAETDAEEPTSGTAKKAFRNVVHSFKKLAKQSSSNAVQSTWIAGLDFDHQANDCVMRLSDGRNYTVKHMDPDTYYSWVKAPSKGKFFHRYIKGQYLINNSYR